VLGLLEGRVTSPVRLAEELHAPLATVAYHVRALLDAGLIELVGSLERRGAVEHRYTARLPTVSNGEWSTLPIATRRAIIESGLEKIVMQSVASMAAGGFDRDDVHLTRSPLRLDRKGWEGITRELDATLDRVERIAAESASRLALEPDAEIDAPMVVMMLFERPGRARELPASNGTPANGTPANGNGAG
jgi:hypothetical protein